MPYGDPIPSEHGVDLYRYRTYGEVDYVEALTQLQVRQWRDTFAASREALCFRRPSLRADFQYDACES